MEALAGLGVPVAPGQEGPVNPLVGLAGAALLGTVSLVLVGWFTLPIGALTGALIGWLESREARR
jgi:hypothetical protein